MVVTRPVSRSEYTKAGPSIRFVEILPSCDTKRWVASRKAAVVDGEIVAVFVHPRLQKGGRGKALMKALEHEARASGMAEIGLAISLPSKRFYESLGYKVVEEKSIDVGEGQRLDFWKAVNDYRPRGQTSWSRALVRHGAEARAAIPIDPMLGKSGSRQMTGPDEGWVRRLVVWRGRLGACIHERYFCDKWEVRAVKLRVSICYPNCPR
jgi:GNAT superfamily N-acetyltransferase